MKRDSETDVVRKRGADKEIPTEGEEKAIVRL